MGPISNVGSAFNGAAHAHALSMTPGMKGLPAGSVDASGYGASQIAGATSSLTSMSATRVSASVSSMLSGLGGGLENDKLLRTIIALLILSALLDSGRSDSANALGALNDGSSRSSLQVNRVQLSIFVENSIQQYAAAAAPGTEVASSSGVNGAAGAGVDVTA